MLIFAVTFGYVFLRAFQQRNVSEARYGWMVPVSYFMAAFDVCIISTVARNDGSMVWLVFQMGTGGALGSVLAVMIHKRMTGDGNG